MWRYVFPLSILGAETQFWLNKRLSNGPRCDPLHTHRILLYGVTVGGDWQVTEIHHKPLSHYSSEPRRAGVPSVSQFFANILSWLADDNLLRISNPKIWLREDFISHYDLGRRALTKASTTLILQWAVKPSQLWPLSSDFSVSKHPWWDVWWYMWFEQQSLTERGWESGISIV